MRTPGQRAGDYAETIAIDRLASAGWRILARNVRIGRDELDIVAIDPGPPPRLVVAEVRWRRDRAFGLPEETVDWRKQARIRRAALRLAGDGRLPTGEPLPALPLRIDLIVLEPAGRAPAAAGGRLGMDAGSVRLRHHRNALDGSG